MSAVCVFCASSQTIDERYLDLASEVGRAVAARGWELVSGAGSISMMGALGSAARAAGGHTIGVIPEALVAREVADHDSDEFIVTRDMRQRKGIMDERSDAFLALPGGIGTLEELVEAWTARSLNMHHKPVVVLDPWGDYAHLHALL
ncbi:MAG: TIGR00730 family Rossman fold protein, partial [Candidatus Nanopelagicales bacterium]